jgi:hypothetical protein
MFTNLNMLSNRRKRKFGGRFLGGGDLAAGGDIYRRNGIVYYWNFRLLKYNTPDSHSYRVPLRRVTIQTILSIICQLRRLTEYLNTS